MEKKQDLFCWFMNALTKSYLRYAIITGHMLISSCGKSKQVEVAPATIIMLIMYIKQGRDLMTDNLLEAWTSPTLAVWMKNSLISNLYWIYHIHGGTLFFHLIMTMMYVQFTEAVANSNALETKTSHLPTTVWDEFKSYSKQLKDKVTKTLSFVL